MEEILDLDKKLFLELNGAHDPVLDQIMAFMSTTMAWLPLYLLLLYLIIKHFRKQTWMVLLAIVLTVVLADQVTSTFMKPFFERLRPTHDPELKEVVHVVNEYRGRKFGFASSHAANTFAIATLMWLLLKTHRPQIGLLFLWAMLVGYTRIYLGVHFPGDILAGQFVGFLASIAVYFLFLFSRDRIGKKTVLRSGSQ
jgi:undecaprenyl-diphosphatase